MDRRTRIRLWRTFCYQTEFPGVTSPATRPAPPLLAVIIVGLAIVGGVYAVIALSDQPRQALGSTAALVSIGLIVIGSMIALLALLPEAVEAPIAWPLPVLGVGLVNLGAIAGLVTIYANADNGAYRDQVLLWLGIAGAVGVVGFAGISWCLKRRARVRARARSRASLWGATWPKATVANGVYGNYRYEAVFDAPPTKNDPAPTRSFDVIGFTPSSDSVYCEALVIDRATAQVLPCSRVASKNGFLEPSEGWAFKHLHGMYA